MSTKGPDLEGKEESSSGIRPVGLSFSSAFLAITGVYYLVYPILASDTTLLYLTGPISVLSLLGSYGIWRTVRWGLWLGLLSPPLQLVATSSALAVVVQPPYSLTDPIVIGFIASLAVLILLSILSFLMVLDRRRSFA
ncbi:hypothetical protein E6H36_04635 [Candidatus Bathyarchaeota archaeon]|nr:MAG: hypothetical protein AUJ07_11930 [Crenarchaeota archaeon 13_1_40CM_3_53_5]TMI26861.1 MAG: hypothetical protein E6H36_04635 [Candidatus Bathyarchaeota archaeon]TMI29727.1 MAG: hypothetical protein E6H29_10595 [Candidatus Bathyarchaeota archaeon]